MKKIFFVLLLANAIFFAWMQSGGFDGGRQTGQELPPLHEEKIRLVDDTSKELVKVPVVQASATQTFALPPALDVQSPKSMSEPASSQQQEIAACLEWGDFSGQELVRATVVLSALQLGDKLNQREIEYDTGFWVYIPPLRNKSAANKKIRELKELGIREYFVVSSTDRWRNAISLGVFKTHNAAQNHFDNLRKKGVRTAKIGERASKFKTTRFALNGVNAETKEKLTGFQKDFPGSELENVPCALTRQDEIGKMPRSSR